jgi:hypothetical protein
VWIVRLLIEPCGAAWSLIEEHFRHHAALIRRFERTTAPDVIRMWRRGCNEKGEPLSPLEREALVERYCELFGRWPADHDTGDALPRRIPWSAPRITERHSRSRAHAAAHCDHKT